MDRSRAPETPVGLSRDGDPYLTFALGAEHFALELLRVQEIRGFASVTPIPNAPAFLKGVMNLRGTVIPVVDLRTRFGMQPAVVDRFTVIIIAHVASKTMGLVVDSVSDVLHVAKADVQPARDIYTVVDSRFISGVAKVEDRLVLILDVDKSLGSDPVADAAT